MHFILDTFIIQITFIIVIYQQQFYSLIVYTHRVVPSTKGYICITAGRFTDIHTELGQTSKDITPYKLKSGSLIVFTFFAGNC